MSDSPAEARAASFVGPPKLIHLTLLAICLAAIIAVTSVTASYLDRSADETKQLLALRTQWQNGEWLKKAIDEKRSQIRGRTASAPPPKVNLSYRSKSGF